MVTPYRWNVFAKGVEACVPGSSESLEAIAHSVSLLQYLHFKLSHNKKVLKEKNKKLLDNILKKQGIN